MRWILALLIAVAPTLANAQVSGTAAFANDYRFRGVSLSAGRPVAQLDAAVDFAHGAYSGLFLSEVQFARETPRRAQAVAYAGYARRLETGGSVDAGLSLAAFPGNVDYDYGELHLGLAGDAWSARVFYSPNYFGLGTRTVYSEINATRVLSGRWRAFAHAGELLVAGAPVTAGRFHADGSIGLEFGWNIFTVQLSRVICDGAASTYPVSETSGHGAWVARMSGAF